MTHTKDEALDKALEAAYLAGFNASGEGYNFEHPFQRHNAHPEQDAGWVKGRDNKLSAIKRYAAMLHTPPAPVPLTDEQARDWFAGMPEEYRKEAWRVATQPAQPAVPLTDDTRRLDALAKNSWDLRCFDMSSEDIGWRVIEHHMAKPHKRTVAEVFRDDPRQAIDAAIEAAHGIIAAPKKGGAA